MESSSGPIPQVAVMVERIEHGHENNQPDSQANPEHEQMQINPIRRNP
jgi:hypothetical protein